MGIARDYYRDVHMRRLENVPVYYVSPKPHASPRPEASPSFMSPLPGGLVAAVLDEAERGAP
jgi:hypothetical protein